MILLSYLFNNNLYYCRFMYNIYQNVNNIKKTQFVFFSFLIIFATLLEKQI